MVHFVGHERGGAANGLYELRVVAAAAQVPLHAGLDIRLRSGLGFSLSKPTTPMIMPGRAVTALESALGEECLLDRVKLSAVGEAFDGQDVLFVRIDDGRDAGSHALPFNSTVQARHWPSPQPYLVPVSFSSSRRTSSKGR